MKKLAILALLVSFNAHAIGYFEASVTLSTSTEAQQVYSTSTKAFSCTFTNPTANAGDINLAVSSANATVTDALAIASGSSFTESAPRDSREKLDLSDYYWNTNTTGDRLIIHCVK